MVWQASQQFACQDHFCTAVLQLVNSFSNACTNFLEIPVLIVNSWICLQLTMDLKSGSAWWQLRHVFPLQKKGACQNLMWFLAAHKYAWAVAMFDVVTMLHLRQLLDVIQDQFIPGRGTTSKSSRIEGIVSLLCVSMGLHIPSYWSPLVLFTGEVHELIAQNQQLILDCPPICHPTPGAILGLLQRSTLFQCSISILQSSTPVQHSFQSTECSYTKEYLDSLVQK